MNLGLKITSMAFVLSASSYVVAEPKKCVVLPLSLTCHDAGYFIQVLPIYKNSFSSAGNFTQITEILRKNQCWIAPQNATALNVKVDGKRSFKQKGYTAHLLHFKILDGNFGHKTDKYSPEGEYLGEQMRTTTYGWTGINNIECK